MLINIINKITHHKSTYCGVGLLARGSVDPCEFMIKIIFTCIFLKKLKILQNFVIDPYNICLLGIDPAKKSLHCIHVRLNPIWDTLSVHIRLIVLVGPN